jgi:hypothetical protein
MTIICQPPYPDKFKTGDVAVSKTNVDFTDGQKHHIGQEIVVKNDTVSYYNVMHQYYDLKE